MNVAASHRDATPGPSIFPGCLSWAEHSTDHGQGDEVSPQSPTTLGRPLYATPPVDGTSTVFLLCVLTNRALFPCSFTDCVLPPRKRPVCEVEGAHCAPSTPVTRRRIHPSPTPPSSAPPSATSVEATLSKRQLAQRERRARERKTVLATASSVRPPPHPTVSKFVVAQRKRREREREARIRETLLHRSALFQDGHSSPTDDRTTDDN